MAMVRSEAGRYPLGAVATRALALWLAALLVLGGAFWLLNRAQRAEALRGLGAQQRTLVDRAAAILVAELVLPSADLPYIAGLEAVRQWSAGGDQASLERLGAELLTLARHRPDYAKLRLFDARARELVRVNQGPGGPRLVPAAELQDKAGRYFVHEGLDQPQHSIHVSRFDLNQEGGAIERPFRPMVRFGLPVWSPDGVRRGLLTINYGGRALLGQLAALAVPETAAGVWLLDGEGHWLLAERPEEAWAFEFAPAGEGARFGDRHAAAWALLRDAVPGETGQAEIAGELFAWRRVVPPAPEGPWRLTGPGAAGWLLVSRLPRSVIAAAAAVGRRPLWGGLAALGLAALAAALALAHAQLARRQSLARLRASEARLRGLLEAAPDALVILDERGRIRLLNARAEEWFGYRAAELLGQPVELLVPDRLRDRQRELFDAYLAAPRSGPLPAGAALAALRRDGSEFPIELSLSPVVVDEGRLVIAVIRDITERRALERAREEAWARYRQLLDNLPVGVFRSSMSERLADDRHFIEVNPALVAMFEAGTAERLRARPLPGLYHDDRERAALVAELFALGFVVGRELQMVTLNGRVFDARLSAALRRGPQRERFVDGVIEDVSDRRRAERERDRAAEEARRKAAALEGANRELEAFSYSVSHDLRAPLRAVDGFTRILEQEYGARLDEVGRGYLARVRAAAQHMAALIDDLLKLARVARSELQPVPVALSDLAWELAAALEERQPGHVVEWRIQPGLSTRGDARLLRVALDNLFDNAWKFTRGRCPALVQFGTCAEAEEAEEREEVVYYVRDNGVGFDMAYADKLFGAFQRLHDASEFPGTGIGLATVQRVIHKHGGRIWAEAAVDQGATFYFTLGAQEAA
ncbi:MAG: sensor histidine kinase [Pseudomonadota bacterium]